MKTRFRALQSREVDPLARLSTTSVIHVASSRPGRPIPRLLVDSQATACCYVCALGLCGGGLRTATLSNGTKIYVRPFSSGKFPTLEIDTPDNPLLKIRY